MIDLGLTHNTLCDRELISHRLIAKYLDNNTASKSKDEHCEFSPFLISTIYYNTLNWASNNG